MKKTVTKEERPNTKTGFIAKYDDFCTDVWSTKSAAVTDCCELCGCEAGETIVFEVTKRYSVGEPTEYLFVERDLTMNFGE